MTEQPLITIGIPTYNRSAWLQQSIASCLQQTYRNIEVVVSDNASTDDTAEMIQRLTDPRIRYVRHENPLPPYVNWNTCWQHARGEYMTYLSDDDLLDQTFLETLLEEVLRHPKASLYRTGLRCIDAEGNVKWEHLTYPYLETPEQFMSERIRNRRRQFLPGFLFKTADMRAVEGFVDNGLPAMLYLDDYLWFRLVFKGAAVVSVSKALWSYRQHDMQYGGEALNLGLFARGVPHYIALLSTLTRAVGCSEATTSFVETQYGRNMIESRIYHEMARERARSKSSFAQKKRWNGDVDKRTLVLVGNGPSLREFDLASMEGVHTLGMNGAYRYWAETGWYPSYYAALDTVFIESHKLHLYWLIRNREKNGIRFFLLRRNMIDFYPELKTNPNVIIFDDYLQSPYFEGVGPLTTGSHAALFAAMLGYKKVVLLGIDAIYVQQIPEAEKAGGNVLELKKTPSQNPNYFFDDYQQKGDCYTIPDSEPDLHYNSWVAVKRRLDELSVQVVNVNPRSKVDLFDLTDCFSK